MHPLNLRVKLTIKVQSFKYFPINPFINAKAANFEPQYMHPFDTIRTISINIFDANRPQRESKYFKLIEKIIEH